MDWGETSPISVSLRRVFGFVPNVFRAQGLLMRIPEALSGLATAVILPEQSLTRIRKHLLMLAVGAANRNVYCVAWHHRSLRLLGVPDSQLNRIISDHNHAGL
jgi:AhpD family alkylhydroperoxidase